MSTRCSKYIEMWFFQDDSMSNIQRHVASLVSACSISCVFLLMLHVATLNLTLCTIPPQVEPMLFIHETTIHNGNYYLMGGINQEQSVFCASLQSLIAKATQQSPTSPSSGEQKSVWETLSHVPYQHSATTILGAALVAVGGRDSGTPRSSLHMYSSLTRSWLHVGKVPVAVCATCTITLPTGEMMVIGGITKDTRYSRLVYKASLQT